MPGLISRLWSQGPSNQWAAIPGPVWRQAAISASTPIRFGNQDDQFSRNNPAPSNPAEDNPVSSSTQPMHMLNDVPYKKNGVYQMVVEIPAGTNEKWQTDPVTGRFYHDQKDGKPRIINFLPYPFNYGCVPQTVLPKSKGGDGDPLDIITLAPGSPRGSVLPARVIGALNLSERGETDTKIVAVVEGGPFADVQDMADMLMKYPGTIEIIRLWFEGYKGPGSFLFNGYATRAEAEAMIEESHRDWVNEVQAAKP